MWGERKKREQKFASVRNELNIVENKINIKSIVGKALSIARTSYFFHDYITYMLTLIFVLQWCDVDMVVEHNVKSDRALRSEVPVAIIENVAVWCEVYLVSCPLLSVCSGLKVFPFLSPSLTSLYIPSLPFSAIFSKKIVSANRSSISVCCLNFASLFVPFRISLYLALSLIQCLIHTQKHTF